MKLKLFISLLFLGILFSCTKEEIPADPMKDFYLLETINLDSYRMELYATNHQWTLGYNQVYFRIKDAEGKTINNPDISWTPVMHMVSKTHSCPVSSVSSSEFEGIGSGFVIFQMPSNDSEYWDISFNITINGSSMSVTKEVEVNLPLDNRKRVSVFMDANEQKYVLALVEPSAPKIAVNDIRMKLFKMETMMSFSVVPNGTILLDPRMPSMDNHSSPNNVDLSYNPGTNSYEGKLSLTMSGYWKLNLQYLDSNGQLVKGNEVTDTTPSSNLYLELEF